MVLLSWWIVISGLSFFLGLIGFYFFKTRSLNLELKESKTRIQELQGTWTKSLVSDRKHGLKSVTKRTSHSKTWDWRCECGRTDYVDPYSPGGGSEENAIKEWKKHVAIHEKYLVPTHEHSHAICDKRFVGLWSLFERFREACYCQTANDDLIVLNEEVKVVEKSLEKSSKKGVQEAA